MRWIDAGIFIFYMVALLVVCVAAVIFLSLRVNILPFNIGANLFGIMASLLLFIAGSYLLPVKYSTLKTN